MFKINPSSEVGDVMCGWIARKKIVIETEVAHLAQIEMESPIPRLRECLAERLADLEWKAGLKYF
jgi:hypothetical protein